MFDEPNQNKIPEPPKNLPSEPEDIFAGLDEGGEKISDINTALNAGVLKKKESDIGVMPSGKDDLKPGGGEDKDINVVKEPILGTVMIVLGMMILVGGVGYGVWRFCSKNSAEKTVAPVTLPPVNSNLLSEQDSEGATVLPVEPVTNTAAVDMGNDRVLFGEAVDTDQDGLDDVRERELGTSLINSDTDGDGLNDADEVIIWKTDPLNPDTDNDTYKDGEEVRNGYDPLGPGKLFSEQNSAGNLAVPDSAGINTTSK